MSENTQQQQQNPDATGASTDLSTTNQPAGTVRIEDGIAYGVDGMALGAANESAPAKIDYEALAKQFGSVGSQPTSEHVAQFGSVGNEPTLVASAAPPAPIDYEALAKQ